MSSIHLWRRLQCVVVAIVTGFFLFYSSSQGFVIKGINHTGQIFLTRPSVSSCVRHGCNPLEKIPADLSDDWTFLVGHFIRLLDFSFDQAQTQPTLPPTPFLRARAPLPHPFFLTIPLGFSPLFLLFSKHDMLHSILNITIYPCRCMA
jgi:hypothetical protein